MPKKRHGSEFAGTRGDLHLVICSKDSLELMSVPVNKQCYALPERWEKAIDGWLTWLKIAGSPATTIRLRRGHIRFIASRSETADPSAITQAALVRLLCNQSWSNEHRRGVRRSLVAFYEWAQERGIASGNPAAGLPKVPAAKPRPRPCPDPMWRELLTESSLRERMMARLAGEVGMRRAEVSVCHRDDLISDGIGWALVVHGKGGKQRVVPITDRMANDIANFCRSGYLFPGNIDGHLSAHHVGKLIGNLMPDGWSMHKLRHRFATRGLAGTGDLLAVRDALGHASVATTQIYTAVADDKVRRVAEAAADTPYREYGAL